MLEKGEDDNVLQIHLVELSADWHSKHEKSETDTQKIIKKIKYMVTLVLIELITHQKRHPEKTKNKDQDDPEWFLMTEWFLTTVASFISPLICKEKCTE